MAAVYHKAERHSILIFIGPIAAGNAPVYIPVPPVGARRLPGPKCSGAAASDAQAAAGVCCRYWAERKERSAKPPLEGVGAGHTTRRWGMSKCTLSRERIQEKGAPQPIQDAPVLALLRLDNHRSSGPCHSATNKPPANAIEEGTADPHTRTAAKSSTDYRPPGQGFPEGNLFSVCGWNCCQGEHGLISSIAKPLKS